MVIRALKSDKTTKDKLSLNIGTVSFSIGNYETRHFRSMLTHIKDLVEPVQYLPTSD